MVALSATRTSTIFRSGGNSTFQCGINHRHRRPAPPQRAAAGTSTSTVNRNRIFRTKEVILLPGGAENEVVRGLRVDQCLEPTNYNYIPELAVAAI